MKEMIRLIAIDMDGTLLRSDQSIDPETIRDLQNAADNGLEIVLCTGRALAEMGDQLPLLPMVRFVVCCSGALVYDRVRDSFLYRNEIPHPFIGKGLETAGKYRAMPQFLTERESIVSASDIIRMRDFGMEAYRPLYLRSARQVENINAEGERLGSAAKFNIYFRSADDRSKGYGDLKQLPLTFAFSGQTALEMTADGVSKATGLLFLADVLNITGRQIAGIGDSGNDLPMLEAVGFSAAMGNAAEEIRSRCDLVTEDNDHNGVGKAVRQILTFAADQKRGGL